MRPSRRAIEGLPGDGDEEEAGAYQREAQDVERAKMRVRLPAKQHLEKMTGVVREPVDRGVAALQPTGQYVNRERKAVHLGE